MLLKDIFKGLGTITNGNSGTPAKVFVVSTLVDILETSPPAYVINDNNIKQPGFGLDILNKLFQCITTLDVKSANPGS
jgi:hypothetical protein